MVVPSGLVSLMVQPERPASPGSRVVLELVSLNLVPEMQELFAMLTLIEFDHSEIAPQLSVTLALTRYVPIAVQL